MADVTVRKLDEFEAIYGGHFRRVRAGLGVSSFGISIIEFPPESDHYPQHDHTHDEQEEVYTLLEGRATLRVGGDEGEEHELVPGVWVRVGPGEKRKIVTGAEQARLLVIGAAPGRVYEPPEFSEAGAPDPLLAKHA
jgi:quercetin dioxygenase-like cupin family protein